MQRFLLWNNRVALKEPTWWLHLAAGEFNLITDRSKADEYLAKRFAPKARRFIALVDASIDAFRHVGHMISPPSLRARVKQEVDKLTAEQQRIVLLKDSLASRLAKMAPPPPPPPPPSLWQTGSWSVQNGAVDPFVRELSGEHDLAAAADFAARRDAAIAAAVTDPVIVAAMGAIAALVAKSAPANQLARGSA
jgi:hypothetical protein